MTERLRRTDRLKLRADFERVQSSGKKVHSDRFLFLVLPREGDVETTRLGVTVTRKVANAVGRNRIKRVLREVFRRNRGLFPAACDVVVIAKDRAVGLGYEDVCAEIERSHRALERAGRSVGRGNRPLEAPVREVTERRARGESEGR